MAALLAGAASALVGVVLCVGLVVIGWVEVPDVSFWSALGLGLRLWLLGHGAGTSMGSAHLTIIPLGLTLLLVLAASGLAGLAAQQVRGEEAREDDRGRTALRLAGLFLATYLGCVMVASFSLSTTSQSARALLGAIAIGFGSGMMGAARGLGWHPTHAWPAWARAIPRAVAAAVGLMLATGLVVLVIALAMHWSRVQELHRALAPGTGGSIVLWVGQLLWVPNLVIWCASWALGSGIGLGAGTVVSPAQNLTGLLPALPVFGAVPANGPGPKVALLWLLSGVLAGAVAAWVIARARRRARCDETALVGGLAGVLSGLVLWLVARLSNGDLGTVRLVDVGARLTELAVMAPTVMGISGLVTGLVLGLVGTGLSEDIADEVPADDDGDEPTSVLAARLDDKVHHDGVHHDGVEGPLAQERTVVLDGGDPPESIA